MAETTETWIEQIIVFIAGKQYWSLSLIFLAQVWIQFSFLYVRQLAILIVRTVMRTTIF
jgi:hypothetical protein